MTTKYYIYINSIFALSTALPDISVCSTIMNESALAVVSQVNETVENDVTLSYSKASNFMANDPKGKS